MASALHDVSDGPCIGMCSTLFNDVCKGWGRTTDEVADRTFMNDDEKRAIGKHIRREGAAMRFRRDGR
ncbi:DUF1289 domain-containing protein [Burkholderia metallica]|uniref:DUF1289 domain-containing protein n=1 Tax=Burkholderia metallica TaxID=488729 RepID=UPI000971524A|nr:DUF1289 domain-containing protein [Burkholderia metallica]MCA8023314.1 DUF1289 domain-containing protein [Burkholderia metallica]VWB95894.1 hypothetical protein BME24068_04591 [Burkholderia metallica]